MKQTKMGGPHGTEVSVDALYAAQKPLVTDFSFGPETTVVFDDMLHRSVPFYDEIQRMLAELAADFAVDGTNVYDLGCSTGATLLNLCRLERDVTVVGLDSSDAMLARADDALRSAQVRHPYILRNQDLDQSLEIDNASELSRPTTVTSRSSRQRLSRVAPVEQPRS